MAKDNNWTEVPNGFTVQVTFAEALNHTNDITLYARSANLSQAAQVTVYPQSQNRPIATFRSISQASTYKVLLNQLQTPEQTFDLQVSGSPVELDWIIDPTFTSLHSLLYGATDGSNPSGPLILSGNTLYGMASGGGAHNNGVIFSVKTDSSGLAPLYSFTGGTDGGGPAGSLTVSGNALYGVTTYGGEHGQGTIFSMNTDGTDFTTLYSFTGSSDGGSPEGSLTVSTTTSDTILYGLTQSGGDLDCGGGGGCGTIFSLDTAGNTFTLIYSFTDGSDGAYPNGSLTLAGTTLYGVTTQGGNLSCGFGGSGCGTVFSIGTGSSTPTTLYALNGGSEGKNPAGSLTLAGTTLYGIMTFGGDLSCNNGDGCGTIFAVNTAGTATSTLYTFTSANGISAPNGDLSLAGNALYGTSAFNANGDAGFGTIFAVNTNGTASSTKLYTFTGGSDGGSPKGSLALAGNTLFGTATDGGSYNAGTIFSFNAGTLNFSPIHQFAQGAEGGNYPHGDLTLSPSGTKLYGMAYGGGNYDFGAIFAMNTDGTDFTMLHSFKGNNGDGGSPEGSLTLAGNTLYGMTSTDGSGSVGAGTIFSMNTDGTDFTTLYTFTGGSDGGNPMGSLTLSPSGTILYGMTSTGGDPDCNSGSGCGTIFSFTIGNSAPTTLYSFTGGSDGGSPEGSLTLSGNTLYGMANEGGNSGNGNIFAFGINSTTPTTLYSFTGGSDGGSPEGSLTLSGNTLYGMTSQGGNSGSDVGADNPDRYIHTEALVGSSSGTIFSFDIGSNTLTTLYSFAENSDGSNPEGSLTLANNALYGMTDSGGTNDEGTIFSFDIGSDTLAPLYSFIGGSDGVNPEGSLIRANTTLYGMASGGGDYNAGAIFSFDLAPTIGGGSVYYSITLTKSGSGNGTITGSGLTCGSVCQTGFISGQSITLTANPSAGSSFISWGGDCGSSTSTACNLTMTGDKNVSAVFQQTGNSGGGGGGIIINNPTASSTASSASSTPTSTSTPSANSTSLQMPGGNTPFPSNTLVLDHGTIYLIMGQNKIGFVSLKVFLGLGYNLRNVITGDTGFYNPQANGYLLSSPIQEHPWGSWIIYKKTVYYVTQEGLIPISSWNIFLQNGGQAKFIVKANKADLALPTLPMMQLNDSRVRQ